VKKGPEKGKAIEVMKRKLDFENISHVSLSTLQVGGCDGYVLYVRMIVKFTPMVYTFSRCIFM
jgi:hypothetical protein